MDAPVDIALIPNVQHTSCNWVIEWPLFPDFNLHQFEFSIMLTATVVATLLLFLPYSKITCVYFADQSISVEYFQESKSEDNLCLHSCR